MATQIKVGWILELIPRVPPPATEGLILVGQVSSVELPYFSLCEPGDLTSFLFRLDEYHELATRELDKALFEVGRTCEGPLTVTTHEVRR
jgi:hypothetical protein